jgi:predicted ester cyclase
MDTPPAPDVSFAPLSKLLCEEVSMSQTHRDLALRWMDEVWNERLESTIDDMLSPECVGHCEGMPEFRGVREFREYRAALLSAMPDMRLDVQDAISVGDNVAVRWRVRGTHDGPGLGIAATHKPVDVWGITWLRFSNGRLVEGWDAWNQGGLLQRLQGK